LPPSWCVGGSSEKAKLGLLLRSFFRTFPAFSLILTSTIRSGNEYLPSIRSLNCCPLWKSDNGKTEDTSATRDNGAGRSESLTEIRTSRLLHSTGAKSKVSQSAEFPTRDGSKLELDKSRRTTLSRIILSSSGPISLPLAQASQSEPNNVSEALQAPTPHPPAQGDVQSERATFAHHHGGFRKAVGGLSERRLAVVRRRHEAQESRSGLRQAREAMDLLDARFIQEMRVLYANSRSSELATLFELSEAMQNQRDKFYPMEDDYNKLEDRLDVEEFELHEAESRLYDRLGSPRTSIVTADDRASLWREEYLEPQPESLSPELQEPAYTDYLSRVGDANIVKERILELRRERMHLVEEERIRANVGRNLDEEGLQFLESFDTSHQQLQDEYAAIQKDLAKMREGLPPSIPLPFATTQFADESYSFGTGIIRQLIDASPLITASDLNTSTSPSGPPSPRDAIAAVQLPRADPLLLPDNDTSPTFTFGDSSGREAVSTVTYVNEWLLNRLRRSSMEIWRFKSAEELQALDLDGAQMRDLVIQWWSRDDKAGDFLSKERAGAISLSLTSNPGVEHQPTRRAWSDGVPHDFDRLASRLQRGDANVRRDVVSINFRQNSNAFIPNSRIPSNSV
jgi:hypothetical protein